MAPKKATELMWRQRVIGLLITRAWKALLPKGVVADGSLDVEGKLGDQGAG